VKKIERNMDNNILKNGGKLKRENKTRFLAKRGKK